MTTVLASIFLLHLFNDVPKKIGWDEGVDVISDIGDLLAKEWKDGLFNDAHTYGYIEVMDIVNNHTGNQSGHLLKPLCVIHFPINRK